MDFDPVEMEDPDDDWYYNQSGSSEYYDGKIIFYRTDYLAGNGDSFLRDAVMGSDDTLTTPPIVSSKNNRPFYDIFKKWGNILSPSTDKPIVQ
jgi:hypothetical protein